MPRLQNCLNFKVKPFTLILALVKHFLSIYKQMQATDRIRGKIKSLQLTSISILIYSSIKTYQMPVINSCTNTFFSRFSNFIMKIVMLML